MNFCSLTSEVIPFENCLLYVLSKEKLFRVLASHAIPTAIWNDDMDGPLFTRMARYANFWTKFVHKYSSRHAACQN